MRASWGPSWRTPGIGARRTRRARAIRAAERENSRHVVVVALTANALEGDREVGIEAGMDDFLTKPLQLHALRAVLERWLPERV